MKEKIIAALSTVLLLIWYAQGIPQSETLVSAIIAIVWAVILLLLHVPITIVAVLAGLIVGMYAIPTMIVAITLNTTISFLAADKLGAKQAKRVKEHMRVLDIIILRLLSTIPNNTLSYGLGLSKTTIGIALTGTILGYLPIIFFAAYVHTQPLTIAGILILAIGPYLIEGIRRGKTHTR